MDKDINEAVSTTVSVMGLPWDQPCGIIKNGAPAMTAEQNVMVSMECTKVPDCGGEAALCYPTVTYYSP